jgi:hypothetical protein
MTTPEDKSLAVQGATEDTTNGTSKDIVGNTPPVADTNVAPVKPTDAEAAAAAAAKAEDDTTAEDKPLDTDAWGTTGDPAGDAVMEIMQNAGMTQADAKAMMYDAITAGDVTKVDQAALIEKVGKARAALILAGTENFIGKQAAKGASILKDVNGSVGSEDNWKQLAAWAKTGVPEAELSEYRGMIDAGGAQARFAAQEILGRYNAVDSNNSIGDAAQITPDTNAAPANRQLTRAEYYAETAKANAKGDTVAINEIQKARERGRAAGI